VEQVISFVQANYIWFIIGIVVVAMTIVGYFAEKTGFSFGGKTKPSKKETANGIDDSVELADVSKEGIADMVKDPTEGKVIPEYEQPVMEQSTTDAPVEPDEKVELQSSEEDLYKPLTNEPKEEEINGIPEELYAPIGGTTPVAPAHEEKVELQEVQPFNMETEESKEQNEDINSEYSRLFPSDPIIIGGEETEEADKEVAQEDVWNI
jgi:hypothetical protein